MGQMALGERRIWFTWLRHGKPAISFSLPAGLRLVSLAVTSVTPIVVGALFAGALLHSAVRSVSTPAARQAKASHQGLLPHVAVHSKGVVQEDASNLAPLADEPSLYPAAPQDQPQACSGRKPPDEGPFHMQVALTFDDGPDLETTPAILSILRAQGLPGTFFFNGEKVASPEHEKLVGEIHADSRMIVGNHGWSHRNLSRLDAGEVAEEVAQTSKLLTRLGIAPNYFRFPFGHASCEARSFVEEAGLRTTGWHVSSADWCYAERDGWCRSWRFRYIPPQHRRDMVGYVMRQLKRTRGGIVLLHDRLPYTVEQLPRLIATMQESGFRFVRLDDPRAFPKLNALGPVAER